MISSDVLLATLVLAPLIGFFINGLRFRSSDCQTAGIIASGAAIISFITSVVLTLRLVALPKDGRQITAHFFDWMLVGDFSAQVSFLVDPISAIMILVVTGVGSLIHIFSIGYMSHDARPAKYFAYLNLFLFNMLLLVLGDNLLIMFVGWEGVGLCSYLLIGFWFTDKEKAAAGMKAFITNRIGDAGFLLGIFTLFFAFGTVNFAELAARMPEVAEVGWTGPIALACLFLFIGATGKSAQIPLYVWLPDAMAGPTPVSALIHAATMVTAGVYMIVRMSHVFVLAPNVMMLIAVVGALTALLAALIGFTQNDIKKVLAYSTVSQLGFMFLGVGVGAFMPAMFHLMTHAFFKALMFLGSGSVIHAMHEEQDIRKMGGLAKKMPITHGTFLIGWLAIIGIPPFAGFFSKDEILWYTMAGKMGHPLLWLIGALAAIGTAFYMTRLMALVFWGESRVDSKVHPHEAPLNMTIPLIILAVLSLVGGWVGIPHALAQFIPGHPPHLLGDWIKPALVPLDLEAGPVVLELILMLVSVVLASVSAWFAYDSYLKNKARPTEIKERLGKAYDIVANKYYVDEFYFGKIINPLVGLSKGLWAYVDVNFIDKTTYFLADLVQGGGRALRSLHNGNLQQYAMYIVVGLLLALFYVLY